MRDHPSPAVLGLLLMLGTAGFSSCRAGDTESKPKPEEATRPAGNHGQPSPEPASEPASIPEEPAELEASPLQNAIAGSRGSILATLEVEGRSGGALAVDLVQGGVPFARGAVPHPGNLRVRGADGSLIPSQARPLALWPDGSSKWIELSFHVEDLGSSGLRHLTVETAGVPGPPPSALPAVSFPEGLVVALEDADGTAGFSLEGQETLYTGPLSAETLFRGSAAGREGRTAMAISVATFPALGAVRYRFEIDQLAGGGLWRRLRLELPHPHAAVHRGAQMDSHVSPAGAGRSLVTLVPAGSHPVDRGTGRRWEIWGGDSLDRLPSHPIRPRLSPSYVEETAALGVAADVPARWRRSFEISFDRVFLQWEEAGQGWLEFGGLPDRDHGLEYYGDLNQEYDPATALILGYARTMEPAYLDTAEDLASSFRDLSVDPSGGVFQHRSTLHTAQAHLIDRMAAGLLDRIHSHHDYEASEEGLLAVVGKLYGVSGRNSAEGILERIDAGPFAQREEAFIQLAAAMLLEGATERIRSRAGSEEIDMKSLFQMYAKDAQVKQLGVTDADEAFAPFFSRYGGSWEDFPAFRVDRHPDPEVRHVGSHSLVEMLVLSYFLTGDEGLRETALRIGRHHLDVLVPREIADNEEALASGRPLFSRSLGWPLINLLSLWELTEGSDPAMNGRIREAAGELAAQLTRNPVERCEGSVSAGIAMEALARYHERTGDAAAGSHLVLWARHWAATQWNPTLGAFMYRHDQDEPAWSSLTGLVLYGLAYADGLEPDAALRERTIEARDSLLDAETGYAKAFAMYYRSVPRALALIESPGS